MKKKQLLLALCVCTMVSFGSSAIATTHEVDVAEVIGKTYDGYETDYNVYGDGGAISNTIASTIKDSVFSNNKAANGGAGGALDIATAIDATTSITNTDFINNISGYEGGAISQRRDAGSLVIDGGNYTGNVTQYEGGAIFAGGKLTVNNATFTGNKTLSTNWNNRYSIADDGGGAAIFVGSAANVSVSNSKFIDNVSNTVGGAIAVRNDSKNNGSNSLTVTDSEFSGNSALVDGGAIASFIDINVFNSKFENNKATKSGGAISLDFGNPQTAGSNGSILSNLIFDSNSANRGGAISSSNGAKVAVDSSTFTNNQATIGGAILQGSEQTMDIKNSVFENNSATAQGGAILSLRNETSPDSLVLNIDNSSFKGNTAAYEGGAIWSGSKTAISNSTFDSNKTTGSTLSDPPNYRTDDEGGGAIFVGSNSKTSIDNSVFTNNESGTVGGAIATRSNATNDGTTTLDITSSNFVGNKAAANGGALASYIDSTVTDTNFVDNEAGKNGGAIWTNQNLTVNATNSDVIMSGNSAADGGDIYMNTAGKNLNMNIAEDKTITVADGISGESYNMIVNADSANTGSLVVNSYIKNATMNVQNGTLHLAQGSSLENSTLNMASGTTLNTIDGNTTDFGSNVTLADNVNLAVDLNLSNSKADNFANANVQGNVTITDINKIGTTTANNINVNLADLLGISQANMTISSELQNQTQTILTPIRYLTGSVSETGMLTMAPTGNSYKDFNPAIMASPVAAQLGGYLTQLNSYDEAFRNMDLYMLMTKEQREAMKLRNKYAASDGNLIFDPTSNHYERSAVWFRPYATFEKVPLKNGPRVSNVAYGSFFGGDSEMYDLGHGWDGMLSVYAGYNGSHQAYDGIGIYQNGGTLGVTGMAYKGNFFTGLTINAGANAGEASTAYGTDNFSMLMAGVASKTGYNWELAKGKFIIQPSYMMSYSFVNTFDYTNAAGVRMESSPLNAIQIEPGIKFIGNLKNGWQPYLGVSMVWNIMDRTNFNANNVSLPELSVKPYVRYGIGVRKTWGDRLSGFIQAFFTGGGRNGVGFQAGFRYNIGKTSSNHVGSNKTPELPKTQIKLSSMK